MSVPAPGMQNRSYVATLAALAVLILAIGYQLRPARQHDEPAPTESELARLTLLSERRSLDDTTAFLSRIANQVWAGVVRLRLDGSSGAWSGVIWNDDLIATGWDGVEVPRSAAVTAAGREQPSAVVVWTPRYAVAGLRRPAGLGTAPVRRRAPLRSGDQVLAVWTTGRDPGFVSGRYVERAAAQCGEVAFDHVRSTIALQSSMIGGGLFDLEGNVIALVATCGGREMALPADEVDRLLALAAAPEERLRAARGMFVEPMSEAEAEHFRAPSGVLVREVWEGMAADRAGVRPGDVVSAIAGESVMSPDDFAARAATTDPIVLRVLRRRRPLEIALAATATASGTAPPDSVLGLRFDTPDAGRRVASVWPDGPARRAGIREEDRILRIDGVAVIDDDAARRALERATRAKAAVFIEFRRGRQKRGVLVR